MICTIQIEAEEREKRLGPGGLDPQEVYEELPPVSLSEINLYFAMA